MKIAPALTQNEDCALTSFAELSLLRHWLDAKAHSRGGDNVHYFEVCPLDSIIRTNRMAIQITKKSPITAKVLGCLG